MYFIPENKSTLYTTQCNSSIKYRFITCYYINGFFIKIKNVYEDLAICNQARKQNNTIKIVGLEGVRLLNVYTLVLNTNRTSNRIDFSRNIKSNNSYLCMLKKKQ